MSNWTREREAEAWERCVYRKQPHPPEPDEIPVASLGLAGAFIVRAEHVETLEYLEDALVEIRRLRSELQRCHEGAREDAERA